MTLFQWQCITDDVKFAIIYSIVALKITIKHSSRITSLIQDYKTVTRGLSHVICVIICVCFSDKTNIFHWTEDEQQALRNVSVIIAADGVDLL